MTLTMGRDERKSPRMESDSRDALEAERAAAEAEVERLRKEQAAMNVAKKREGAEVSRAEISKLSSLVAAARARLDKANAELRIFDKTGKRHAIIAEGEHVHGSIAVRVPPGSSHEARVRLIDDALAEPLEDAARELGVVIAAEPARFVRERPGRDAEGRTILDIAGRVEGDRLVPAVSRASKNLRT